MNKQSRYKFKALTKKGVFTQFEIYEGYIMDKHYCIYGEDGYLYNVPFEDFKLIKEETK